MIAGVTLALLLSVEVAIRVAGRVGAMWPHGASSGQGVRHPYAGEAWYQRLQEPQEMGHRNYRFDPYRGWWPLPQTARYLNIDSAGVRKSVAFIRGSGRLLRVDMLGSSAMWGYSARDSFTIPSLTAEALHRRGLDDIQIANLGVPGYNQTQETITLLLEIARNRIPDVVVVMDGANDIHLALHLGTTGHAWDEKRDQDLIRAGEGGLAGFLSEIKNLQLVQLTERMLPGPRASEMLPPSGSICAEVASYYGSLARAIGALAKDFGFSVVFLQQPYHETTRKSFTPWEAQFSVSGDYRICAQKIDSVMAPWGAAYVPLYRMFDSDTGTIFVDNMAHITESANQRIAEEIAGLIAPELNHRRSRPTHGVASEIQAPVAHSHP